MAKYDERGYITQLDDNEIFVFGSNGDGAHFGGAAKTAYDKFGAVMGRAEGLQGNSYAINTMDGKAEMTSQVARFLQFAKKNPELTFLVTEIGCGIAGYKPKDVALMFAKHSQNIVLPDSFKKVLGETTIQNDDRNRDKARGMLLGLAIGDALGAPVEFGYSSHGIRNLGDEIAHFQNHRLPKGVWTDDTEMALCLADSVLEKGGYDSYDVMDKYRKWMDEGYRTYDKLPASDVGLQTRKAIAYFKRDPKYTEETESAGNGAIMRLAPAVIAARQNDTFSNEARNQVLKVAKLSCQETHNSNMAVAVTEAFASLLYLCFSYDKHFLSAVEHCTRWLSRSNEHQQDCGQQIEDHIAMAIASKNGDEFRDLGGYILDAFTIAIWGVAHSESFKEGLLKVIRLGGDTDTNGAIYGQLAGAVYGYSEIPQEWRDGIFASDELVEIADKLYEMKDCPIIRTRFVN